MSGNDLKVTSDHLLELAEQQELASGSIHQADDLVQGLSGSVLLTHGVVCWATHSAVAEAEGLRHTAANNTYLESVRLNERLTAAAQTYDDIDQEYCHNIDGSGC